MPKIKEHSLNKVLIEADLYAPGLLVLSDACYPGWKAFVDGKETRIYRTNYVMRGVFLPKGRHSVEFKYEPFSFKVGGLLSLTTFVLILGYFAWARVKKTNMVDS